MPQLRNSGGVPPTPPHAFMTYRRTALILVLCRGYEHDEYSNLGCDTVRFGTLELTPRRAEVQTMVLISQATYDVKLRRL